MSIIGWIDFSSEYRRRSMKMLDLLKEPGALDELGIGVVRDAFADFFFPGTSTLQTRAKYFLLIPWIMKDLERKQTPSRDFVSKLRAAELSYIPIFEENHTASPSIGIIGSSSRDKLKRTPSELYWRGITTFALSPYDGLSISQYVQKLDDLYLTRKQKKSQRYQAGDDDVSDDEDITKTGEKPWRVIDPLPDWHTKLSIDLSFDEARCLRDAIIRSNPDSLFGMILHNHLFESLEYSSIWTLPYVTELPAYMQKMIQMAQDFSLLMEGAHIRFNMMLQANRGEHANPAFSEAFEGWNERILSFPWERWDTLELQRQLHLSDHVTRFIQSWEARVRTENWTAAEDLIRKREYSLKHGRSKLANPAKFLDQEDWIGLRTLNYRWPNVKRHIADIAAGLKGGEADA